MEAEENVDHRKGDCGTAEPVVGLQDGHNDSSAAKHAAEMRVDARHEHLRKR